MTIDLPALANTEFCYLTTTGRVTGKPHTIEIWFALQAPVLYMLAGSGNNADWVKNAQHQPEVSVRINEVELAGAARVVTATEEDALARRLILEKYEGHSEDDLTEWGRTSLPVAIDLQV
ncbi:MAG: nitroreductase family deazaflavin-dependent oxidoreductase [Herpetosiphonaceae bacterium]|nr:nitroreductase family deazaflavin-dependent oxidoreductase [Herpetosiphonaceae bacterium]